MIPYSPISKKGKQHGGWDGERKRESKKKKVNSQIDSGDKMQNLESRAATLRKKQN